MPGVIDGWSRARATEDALGADSEFNHPATAATRVGSMRKKVEVCQRPKKTNFTR